MFEKFFKRKKEKSQKTQTEPTVPKEKAQEKTEKELATERGEPYVAILSMDIDPTNIHQGSFDLDWNDKFILNLIRAGYKIRDDDSDTIIVERWFQSVCRNVALELYEQQQADPENRTMATDMRVVRAKNLGDGRTEVS